MPSDQHRPSEGTVPDPPEPRALGEAHLLQPPAAPERPALHGPYARGDEDAKEPGVRKRLRSNRPDAGGNLHLLDVAPAEPAASDRFQPEREDNAAELP